MCHDIIDANVNSQDGRIIRNRDLAEQVIEHMHKNFELILERESKIKFQVNKLSKSIKLCHYLLTSPELGYKHVDLECYLETNKSVDIYIHDIGLAIEMDGPPHYFSNTGERKNSLQDRRTDREIGPLRITYKLLRRFLSDDSDFTAFEEEDFSGVKLELKHLIGEHQAAREHLAKV